MNHYEVTGFSTSSLLHHLVVSSVKLKVDVCVRRTGKFWAALYLLAVSEVVAMQVSA